MKKITDRYLGHFYLICYAVVTLGRKILISMDRTAGGSMIQTFEVLFWTHMHDTAGDGMFTLNLLLGKITRIIIMQNTSENFNA